MLDRTQAVIRQRLGQLRAPPIEAQADLSIAHGLPRSGPAAIENVFSIQHPLAHPSHLRKLACPLLPLGH